MGRQRISAMYRRKYHVKFVLFSALLFAALQAAVLLLYPSNAIFRTWKCFYSLEKDKIDILIVGNSHAYASFDPNVIREMTGKDSYILSSNSQTVVQAYFNVKEALHYQHPDILLLEAFALDENDNFRYGTATPDRDWKKESNIDGMRFGLTKLEAIAAQYFPENWSYALLPITRCHSNWADIETIGSNLFFYTGGIRQYSSFHPSETKMTEETKSLYDTAGYNPGEKVISDVNLLYFHKLAQLCREEQITLFLVMAPMYDGYIRSINYEDWKGKLEDLAEGENISYIDCNVSYDEIGLISRDFEDAYLSFQHLNKDGADKVTRFVFSKIYED